MNNGYVTIIAGSQTITDRKTVEKAIQSAPFDINEVVSGTAAGVDTLGEEWASDNSIPVTQFPPHEAPDSPMPDTLRRNIQMAEYAEALIAVWNGTSPGTEHMIDQATSNELTISIYRTDTSALSDF